MSADARKRTLCVDLDGTLIRSDLLWECVLDVLKRAPWRLLLVPLWLLQGRQVLKLQLARIAAVDLGAIPRNAAVESFIARERHNYSGVILVTASTHELAERIAAQAGCFDAVLASDAYCNLRAERKATLLTERYGDRGFDYLANSAVDLPVWARSHTAITVEAPERVVRKARALAAAHLDLGRSSAGLRRWLGAIRIHQWTKNALLFVPLITAHRLSEFGDVAAAMLAFVAFGLAASATYILNDLLDLEADRRHARKRERAIASGAIGIPRAIAVGAILLGSGAGLATLLPTGFGLALTTYLVITVLYSMRLKRIASLDVITLAGLYTLRVIAGALAIGVTISFWLLAFSMFIFLCLSIVKRVSELLELAAQNQTAIRGREYSVVDIPILQTLGASSGYLAVLVLALYINSDEVKALYANPLLLWLVAPIVLLWVTRLWMVTARGYMNDDPVVWAIKDPETWLTAAVTGAILVLASVSWA